MSLRVSFLLFFLAYISLHPHMSSRSIPYSPDTENQVLEPWPIRTPPLSLSFTDLSTPSPVQYLENLVEAELYTWSSTFGRYCSHPSDMEPSWRDDASSSSHSYHGLHRRGPSELEGNVVWETSRLNGELGLAPEQGEGNKHLGLALNPSVANARTNTNTYTHGKSTGTGALPLPIAVWAKVMDSSKGRDKVLVRQDVMSLDLMKEVFGRKADMLEMRPIYLEDIPLPPKPHCCCSPIIYLV
jgi:hypothetical protein